MRAVTGPSPQVAPFPYFGGKRRAAPLVWQAIGAVRSYVEPFCGSAACLLARPPETYCDPGWPGVETINDSSGMVSNFWRAVRADPAGVVAACDFPVSELDLHARHRRLVDLAPSLRASLEADPDFFDPKAAGWWAWGASQWIGSGWCPEDDVGHLKQQIPSSDRARGVQRLAAGMPTQLPHLSHAGTGVSRRPPRAGAFAGEGTGHGSLREWFDALALRLRCVRAACGDWKRVVTPAVLWPTSEPKDHLCGIFFDPPYDPKVRRGMRYAVDGADLSGAVRAWCEANGQNARLRIVLAGEAGEHDALGALGWRAVPWKRKGGYSGGEDRRDERLWLSPHCLGDDALPLFRGAGGGRAG